MKNITLSIPEDLLEASRQYAAEHRTSVNQLVREMLAQRTLRPQEGEDAEWQKQCDALARQVRVRGNAGKWTRMDAYEGRV